MTNEKLIKRLIRQETNNVTGPLENALLDGVEDVKIPTRDEVLAVVYGAIINSEYVETGAGMIPIRREVRFCGKETLLMLINVELDKQENDGFKFGEKK